MQHTSEDGLMLIKHFEGFSDTPYLCPAGYQTIGYGHRIRKRENYPDAITDAEATVLLLQDIKLAEQCLHAHVPVELSDYQFSALVSFIYNIGTAAFLRSTLYTYVTQEQHDAVPTELCRWVWAKGKKLPGLIRRREAEAQLYQGIPFC